MPENVHEPYTRKDDALLWANQNKPLSETAAALGRGEKSCAARLERLRNPKTQGHRRLFGAEEDNTASAKPAGLRPRECVQRIIHDPSLSSEHFVVGLRDRFAKALRRAPFDAPNDCVAGDVRQLVLAVPEHRIEGLWYKRRLVVNSHMRIELGTRSRATAHSAQCSNVRVCIACLCSHCAERCHRYQYHKPPNCMPLAPATHSVWSFGAMGAVAQAHAPRPHLRLPRRPAHSRRRRRV
jgi:hypothetical protein